MGFTKASSSLNRRFSRLIRSVHSVGVAIIAVIMLLTVVDVVGRYAFSRPVGGSYELTEFMMAILVSFGIAYTALEKGHIGVDLVIGRLSPKSQEIILIITRLLSLVLFVLIGWQSALQARVYWVTHATSSVLLVPIFPFVYVFVFGCALLCLVLLKDFIESIFSLYKRR